MRFIKTPETHLNSFANSYALISVCRPYTYDGLVIQTENLLSYSLNTWSYNKDILGSKIREKIGYIDRSRLSGESCHSILRNMHSNLSITVQRHMQAEQQAIASISQSAYFHAWRSLNNIQADQLITSMPITQ